MMGETEKVHRFAKDMAKKKELNLSKPPKPIGFTKVSSKSK